MRFRLNEHAEGGFMLSLTLGRRMAHMMIHDLDCLRIPEIRRLFREELRRLLR